MIHYTQNIPIWVKSKGAKGPLKFLSGSIQMLDTWMIRDGFPNLKSPWSESFWGEDFRVMKVIRSLQYLAAIIGSYAPGDSPFIKLDPFFKFIAVGHSLLMHRFTALAHPILQVFPTDKTWIGWSFSIQRTSTKKQQPISMLIHLTQQNTCQRIGNKKKHHIGSASKNRAT